MHPVGPYRQGRTRSAGASAKPSARPFICSTYALAASIAQRFTKPRFAGKQFSESLQLHVHIPSVPITGGLRDVASS